MILAKALKGLSPIYLEFWNPKQIDVPKVRPELLSDWFDQDAPNRSDAPAGAGCSRNTDLESSLS